MRIVAELDIREFQLAAPLDVNLLGPVHHDVGDGLIRQQRLERAEPDHVVDEQAHELFLLGAVELELLLDQHLADDFGDLAFQLVGIQRGRHGDVDAFHDDGLDGRLGLQQALAPGAAALRVGRGAAAALRLARHRRRVDGRLAAGIRARLPRRRHRTGRVACARVLARLGEPAVEDPRDQIALRHHAQALARLDEHFLQAGTHGVGQMAPGLLEHLVQRHARAHPRRHPRVQVPAFDLSVGVAARGIGPGGGAPVAVGLRATVRRHAVFGFLARHGAILLPLCGKAAE